METAATDETPRKAKKKPIRKLSVRSKKLETKKNGTLLLQEESGRYEAKKKPSQQDASPLHENSVAEIVITAAKEAYFDLGPSLAKSAYEAVLRCKLQFHGLRVERLTPALVAQEEEFGKNTLLVIADTLMAMLAVEGAPSSNQSRHLMGQLRLRKLRLGLWIGLGGHPSCHVRRVINGLI